MDHYSFAYAGPIDNIDTTNVNVFEWAFINSQVKTVTLVQAAKGNCAFANCSSLTTVTTGANCTAFYPGIFINSSNVDLQISPENTVYKKEGYHIYSGSILICLLPSYTGTSYTVDPRFDYIEKMAFTLNKNIDTLIVDNSNLDIAWSAFAFITGIKEIQIKSMRAKDIFDRQFWGSYSLEKVSFPEGVLVFGQYTFINCTNLKTVSLPSSLWSIGDGTFYNCISLQSIDVSMLNYLPLYSFYNCSSLRVPYRR